MSDYDDGCCSVCGKYVGEANLKTLAEGIRLCEWCNGDYGEPDDEED